MEGKVIEKETKNEAETRPAARMDIALILNRLYDNTSYLGNHKHHIEPPHSQLGNLPSPPSLGGTVLEDSSRHASIVGPWGRRQWRSSQEKATL